jgi:hypothetical protein
VKEERKKEKKRERIYEGGTALLMMYRKNSLIWVNWRERSSELNDNLD